MAESQKYYAERSQTQQNVCTMRFHFYEAQEQARLIYSDRNPNKDCLWEDGD